MMKLVLKRKWFTNTSVVGELRIDDLHECFTLEDPPREVKIPGVTGIPAGSYDVDITFSNRFGKRMPLLLNVPGFSGIRIHAGNKAVDSEGCILVGWTKDKDFIGQSRDAYAQLFLKLDAAKQANDPITISIVEERDAASHAVAGE